ncbi:MAG: preprotein translocase subunit SecE [Oscillospiraceae bacterium]|nr:preprotein translocase subunit SecE [Oscillospiraceae bacterium]
MADKKADKKKPGFFAKIGKYFRDVKGEFKKIVWPSRKQVLNNVAVVLTMVVIFAVATWGLDLLFAFLRDLLLKLF